MKDVGRKIIEKEIENFNSDGSRKKSFSNSNEGVVFLGDLGSSKYEPRILFDSYNKTSKGDLEELNNFKDEYYQDFRNGKVKGMISLSPYLRTHAENYGPVEGEIIVGNSYHETGLEHGVKVKYNFFNTSIEDSFSGLEREDLEDLRGYVLGSLNALVSPHKIVDLGKDQVRIE